jgi:competence/damage-inducible protein CinA-like protein
MTSPDAEILTIGTELLLGEITDTNTAVIARSLRDMGINLYRTATVGDNAHRIAELLRERFGHVQIIITTGGLGPTVDDPTREAVALALGVPTVFVPELWEQIQDRFKAFGRTPGENNRRQAYIPEGAHWIENPVGTAPAFWADADGTLVVSLPGVPAEMSHLLEHAVLPLIQTRYDLGEVIRARIVRTAGLGESRLDEQIDDLERLTNPTVGVSAHPGRVDIRITARAASKEAAEGLIAPVVSQLQSLLGHHIYGFDKETLEDAMLAEAGAKGWRVSSLEAGSGGALKAALSQSANPIYAGGISLPGSASVDDLRSAMASERQEGVVLIGMHLARLKEMTRLTVIIWGEGDPDEKVYEQKGPAVNIGERSVSLTLDWARRRMPEL